LQDLIIGFFLTKIPDIDFLSEEKKIELRNTYQKKLLIIDPIDGTENFISGIPIWGVALSYWENRQHVSSMIYLPELNKYIITGEKLVYNQSRINGFSSSINRELLTLIEPSKESRIFGCSVFNFYNVITKSFKSFENPKGAYIWDLSAGLNLALEHGCKVTVEGKEYHGEFLDPNKRHRFKVSNE
jgi:myo-inositol-1(or 4)-monophosphatase